MPLVGYLAAGGGERAADWLRAFRQGLKEGGGYVRRRERRARLSLGRQIGSAAGAGG